MSRQLAALTLVLALTATWGFASASHPLAPVTDLVDTRCDTHSCTMVRLDDDANPNNVIDLVPAAGNASGPLYWGPGLVWTSASDGLGSGLDADRLDGLDSSAFLTAVTKAPDSDLLDGLDSTAFLLATGKAADADLLDGLDSTAFLLGTGKAADADLLDGLDSTAFASSSHLHDERYLLKAAKAADADLLDGRDSSAFAPAQGSGNYLQNQFAAPQASDFWMNGNARLGPSIGTTQTRAPLTVHQADSGGVDSVTALFLDRRYNEVGDAQDILFGAGFDGEPGTARIRSMAPAPSEGALAFSAQSAAGGQPEIMRIQGNGNVGIGTASPGARLHVAGDIRADGHIFAHSSTHIGDIAEPAVGAGLEPGDVVVLDGFEASGKLRVKEATEPYSSLVVGVVSTNPSLRLAGLPEDTPLAVSGIVPVKVTGVVEAGDLLATSAVTGHAMACTDHVKCFGAVLGKALEGHDGETGAVRAMVSLG